MARLKKVVNAFLTHRQMGPAEALYRIIPSLFFSYFNVDTIFIPSGLPQNRSKFLIRIEENETVDGAIEVEGKEGFYKERRSILDKYCLRDITSTPSIKYLTYAQFCRSYTKSYDKKDTESALSDNLASGVEIESKNYIIQSDIPEVGKTYALPKRIKINSKSETDPPEYMRLRSPLVIRFHKFNINKDPHEFRVSTLQLYIPFQNEKDLFLDDENKCKQLYLKNIKNIQNIKEQMFPYLEDVEEARSKVSEGMHKDLFANTLLNLSAWKSFLIWVKSNLLQILP